MSGRGMVELAMAAFGAREALAEAKAAQRELVEEAAASAVARMAREPMRRAAEERLARALQWLGAHLLDALEAGAEAELVRGLAGGEAPRAPDGAPEVAAEAVSEVAAEAVSEVAAEVVDVPREERPVIDAYALAALNAALRDNQGGPRAAGARVVADGVALVPASALPVALTNALVQAGRVLGPTPARLSSGNEIEAEVGRLEEALRTTLAHWGAAGKAVDHALTSWVAARARAAQEAAAALLGPARAAQIGPRIDAIISRLGRHTKETWPGKVHGLARKHMPEGESWTADAQLFERTARRLLPHGAVPEVVEEVTGQGEAEVADRIRRLWEDLRAGREAAEIVSGVWRLVVLDGLVGARDPRVVGLVRALVERTGEPVDALGLGSIELGGLAKALADDLEEEARTERRGLPEGWPGFAVTRGVVAAIVGGVPRNDRVEALRELFGFGSLEWIANGCDRPLDTIVQRMRSGSLGLVIVLSQLVSHNASDRLFAARDTGCRVVLADSYGVGGIRLALERYAASAMG